MSNVYDVTTFTSPSGTSPFVDIGKVINEIIAAIKTNQTTQKTRPGATIYIPPGHYVLLTRVVIDIDHLQIKGSGHGWLSQAVRDDAGHTPPNWQDWLPGGSHVSCQSTTDFVAFYLYRQNGTDGGAGRISGVEFRDFCIDGGTQDSKPYSADKRNMIGIAADSSCDSIRIEGMTFSYLSTCVVNHLADAWYIVNNFMCEVGSCIEFRDYSTNNRVLDNFLWNSWSSNGWSVYMESGVANHVNGNHAGWRGHIGLVSGTNGDSRQNLISSNVIQSCLAELIYLDGAVDNMITGNKIIRKGNEGDIGLTDDAGLVHIAGSQNTMIANEISVDAQFGSVSNAILVNGSDNYFMMNRILDLSSHNPMVKLQPSASGTRVIYSATAAQFNSNGSTGTQFVATP